MNADGIGYWDENGEERVQMSDLGIAYWDENGDVVWRTPER
jgi:hypothetical protein